MKIRNYMLLFIPLFFLFGCKRTVGEKLGAYLKKNDPNEITLSDFTNFDWDYVWICQNIYTDKLDSIAKEKNINTDYLKKTNFLMHTETWMDLMIFLNKGKIVYADYPSMVGSGSYKMDQYSFSYKKPSEEYLLFSKAKAKFNTRRGYKADLNYHHLKPIYLSMDCGSLPVYHNR